MTITATELETLVSGLVGTHGRERLAISSMLSFFASVGPDNRKCETHFHMNTLWKVIEPYLDAKQITARELRDAAVDLSRANSIVEIIDQTFPDEK